MLGRTFEISVVTPYRLDLTVSVLRRLSTNIVDLLTPEGGYVRALSGFPRPVIVCAAPIPHRHALCVTIDGDECHDAEVLQLLRRTLGTDRDIAPFLRAARHIAWLAPLARRMRGVKPPRYPSLWEACANAIVFQQVSLRAASTIMGRLIVAIGRPVKAAGLSMPLYLFPTAKAFQRESDAHLRAAGLSGNKAATLRRVAAALTSGALDVEELERCTSTDAIAILCGIKGIGPWTATVILLRGLGRLDVFPANDTSVASNIALIAESAAFDVQGALDVLGAQRGMLYYHLLLARLESRGEIGRQSFEKPLPVT